MARRPTARLAESGYSSSLFERSTTVWSSLTIVPAAGLWLTTVQLRSQISIRPAPVASSSGGCEADALHRVLSEPVVETDDVRNSDLHGRLRHGLRAARSNCLIDIDLRDVRGCPETFEWITSRSRFNGIAECLDRGASSLGTAGSRIAVTVRAASSSPLPQPPTASTSASASAAVRPLRTKRRWQIQRRVSRRQPQTAKSPSGWSCRAGRRSRAAGSRSGTGRVRARVAWSFPSVPPAVPLLGVTEVEQRPRPKNTWRVKLSRRTAAADLVCRNTWRP